MGGLGVLENIVYFPVISLVLRIRDRTLSASCLCWCSNNQRGLSGSTAIPNPSANAGNTPKPNINRQFPLEANEASMIWARRMPTVNGKLVQGDEAAAQFGRR